MTQERADEILRKVIFSEINVMKKINNKEDRVIVGKMLGRMIYKLDVELSLEVDYNKIGENKE